MPASNAEISEIVTDYLRGDSVSDISKRLFRSPSFVNGVIRRVGVPTRPKGDDRKGASFIPESCVSETFDPGDIVWSAAYHSTAIVKKEVTNLNYGEIYGSKCYRIYVVESCKSDGSLFPQVESGGYFAVSLAYDLGRLSHLEKYGIDLKRL